MEYQAIKNLLDRYFRGETSLEEEQTLREYFRTGSVDERLTAYAPLFQWMVQEQAQTLEDQKAADLLEKLDRPTAKRIPMNTSGRMWILRVAAVLALMVGMWWTYENRQTDEQTAEVDWSKYEIKDEEEALRITRGALLKASRSLNSGANAAADQMDRMQEIGKFFR